MTRSWNWGIRRAIDMGARYVIAGNSDILFCEGWYRGLVEALESGHALAGPISNAPGPTSRGKASITAYYPGFRLVDDLNYLNYVSGVLCRAYLGYHVEASINGFFQMARADVWWAGRYDDDHVYQPRNLMTGSEDELQARWARRAGRPSSAPRHSSSITGPSRAGGITCMGCGTARNIASGRLAPLAVTLTAADRTDTPGASGSRGRRGDLTGGRCRSRRGR